MTDELRHPARTNEPDEPPPAPDRPEADAPDEDLTDERRVPVAESIRYRRRAQRAETKLTQLEQQLADVQAQLDGRLEQLAAAEAQRDELRTRLELGQTRASAEGLLRQAGVADVEMALALLEKRTDLAETPDAGQLEQQIQRLIQDKPILLAEPPRLPGKTASARQAASGPARLARAATRAAASGSRRDVAEYLRLRRQQEAYR